MILLGSRAAKFWFSDFRKPKDYDIMGTIEEYNSFIAQLHGLEKIRETDKKRILLLNNGKQKINIEFELDILPSTKFLLEKEKKFDSTTILKQKIKVPDPSILFLIKRSHLYWNIHWEKSINDYHWIKTKSNIPSPCDYEFYSLRHSELKQRFEIENIKRINITPEELKKRIKFFCKQKFKLLNEENINKTLKILCFSKSLGYSDLIIENYNELKQLHYDS